MFLYVYSGVGCADGFMYVCACVYILYIISTSCLCFCRINVCAFAQEKIYTLHAYVTCLRVAISAGVPPSASVMALSLLVTETVECMPVTLIGSANTPGVAVSEELVSFLSDLIVSPLLGNAAPDLRRRLRPYLRRCDEKQFLAIEMMSDVMSADVSAAHTLKYVGDCECWVRVI